MLKNVVVAHFILFESIMLFIISVNSLFSKEL